jgi:pyrimidine operon attenuation protein/uracil phosphoribosyltransferase
MPREKAEIMDEKAMLRAIARIAYEIIESNHGTADLCIIGIKRRGTVIAKLIADKIYEIEGTQVNLGYLDITRYRDDLPERSTACDSSEIPFDVTGKRVVLVDDVIFTGRSVRAAIDAIMDMGRPSRLQLAELVDRGHRELPIRADFVGKNVPTSRSESVGVMVTEYDGVNRVVILDNSEGDAENAD